MVIDRLFKKFKWPFLIGFFSFMIVFGGHFLGGLDFLEYQLFDYRVKFSEKYTVHHPDIVLILIDEPSLTVMDPLIGRWPWPRSTYASLISFLSRSGARLQGFDILFTESQKEIGRSGDLSSDRQLVHATSLFGPVFHAFQLSVDRNRVDTSFLVSMPKLMQSHFVDGHFNNAFLLSATDCFLPFDALLLGSAGIGFVDVRPDSDGVVRSVDLFREYQGHVFSSLPVRMALSYLDDDQSVRMDRDRVIMGRYELPLSRYGDSDISKYLVKLKRTFQTFSAGAVLQTIQALNRGDLDDMLISPEVFKDKIVFIGTSAIATYDRLDLSLDTYMPGVFLQASVLDNILLQDMYRVIPFWINGILALGLILGAGLIVWCVVRFVFQVIGLIVLGGGFCVFIVGIFAWQSWVFLMAFPLFCFLAMIVSSYGYLSVVEGKERRKMRGMLAKYVSPVVLSEVIDKSADVVTPEVGSHEQLTVLFSDIRQFTQLAESLPADQVVEMLNYYLAQMVDVIFDYQGTLDKFIGDSIMAFWGAPLRSDLHATDAVVAALEMSRSQSLINSYYAEKGWPLIQFGVGVHTGSVILGNIGSTQHLDYTIIGDTVNFTSRLEGLTGYYNIPILISDQTKQQLDSSILVRIVDYVQVKGKSEAVFIFQPLGYLNDDCNFAKLQNVCADSDQAFDLYQKRIWDQAILLYDRILKQIPDDGVALKMIDRCRFFKESPPDQLWDGRYIFEVK